MITNLHCAAIGPWLAIIGFGRVFAQFTAGLARKADAQVQAKS
ncbi:MAG: hypothetical protein WC005_07195 [Candidatus Nanopelagicales bacterium]